MRKTILLIFSLASSALSCFSLDFAGTSREVISIAPAASTGLESIYVLDSTAGAKASYTASSPSENVVWYRFSNLGGAYAEEVTAVSRNGRVSTITLSAGDMGYIVEAGGRRHCYWTVDYSAHEMSLSSISFPAEQDCDRTSINVAGSAEEIPFYTINGRRETLSRDIEIEYNTLVFDEETFRYEQTKTHEVRPYLTSHLTVPAPLCDTRFTISGDRFLSRWGIPVEISSESLTATSVAAETKATQTQRENDNEQTEEVESLGGSAPCEITFEAAVSDAAIFREWQISKDPEFNILENSYNQESFSYIFEDSGTTYVRFVANNDSGTCEYSSQTYEVFIGESRLEIPNAFSPGASEGVNDIWKVSYKSLVSFECHIFNRWGTQMASFTDPAQGWDGKYNGKLVPAGTYFYVIKARGADGTEYDRSGDINIINYNVRGTGQGESSGTPAE